MSNYAEEKNKDGTPAKATAKPLKRGARGDGLPAVRCKTAPRPDLGNWRAGQTSARQPSDGGGDDGEQATREQTTEERTRRSRRRVQRWGVCQEFRWMEGREEWSSCRKRYKRIGYGGKGRNRGGRAQLRRAAQRAAARAEKAEGEQAALARAVRSLVFRTEAAEEGIGVWRRKYWGEHTAQGGEVARGRVELEMLREQLQEEEQAHRETAEGWLRLEGGRMWEAGSRGTRERGDVAEGRLTAAAVRTAAAELRRAATEVRLLEGARDEGKRKKQGLQRGGWDEGQRVRKKGRGGGRWGSA